MFYQTWKGIEMKKFYVFNHNGTLLGQFETLEAAEAEAKFYREQTGNAAYVEEQ